MKYTIATVLTFVSVIAAHGWIESPVSKNEMAYKHWVNGMPDSLRYEP